MKRITLLLLLFYCSFCYAQFSENFDGSTTVPDDSGNWSLTSGTWLVRDNMTNAAPQWAFSPTSFPGNGGGTSKAAFIQRENTSQGVLSQEWLITPLQNVPAGYQLRFYTSQTIPGDLGTLYQVRVSSDPDPSNLSAYTVLAEYTETQLSTLTPSQIDYEEKIINLTVTGNHYFAFVKVFTQPSNTLSGDRWLVDDVQLVAQCLDPTQLTASDITPYNATLNWEGTAPAYTVEYGPQGFAPNTGAGTVVSALTATSYTIPPGSPTGPLAPGTFYDFYVTANCAASSSQLTGPFSFKTLAIGAICAFPKQVGALPYIDSGTTSFYGSNIVVPFIDDTNCGVTNFFFGGDDVVYTYTAPATTSGVIDIIMNPLGDPHSAIFVYATCEDIGEDCLASAGDWGSAIRHIPAFAISPGQTIYIVISSNEFNSVVDYQLTIQESLCPAPTGLSALATSSTSSDLSWQQEGSPGLWEVFVQTAGGGLPTSAGMTTANATFTASALTGTGTPLTSGTQYQYWVRASCGDGTFSSWSGPHLFYTACPDACYYEFVLTDVIGDGWAPNTLKITQGGVLVDEIGVNFTDGAGPITVNVPLCNGPFELYLTNFDLTYIDMRVEIINPFNQSIYDGIVDMASVGYDPALGWFFGEVNCDGPLQLCLPPVNLTVGDITTEAATLNWEPQGPLPVSWDVYVVLAGAPAPTATTVPTLNTTTFPVAIDDLNFDTAYQYYVRAVCSFAGENLWSDPSASFTTLEVCNKPTNLILTASSLTSLTIDWTNGAGESSWQYILVPVGSGVPAPDDAQWQTVTSHPYTIENLPSATPYDIYVRSICGTDLYSNATAPLTANTVLCPVEQQCQYTITMNDFDGYGWVLTGNTMAVTQNGITVAVIGSTFTSGTSQQVQVSLCQGVPFELFWLTGGYYNGVGVSITNPQGEVIFTRAAQGEGQPGQPLYFGTGNCNPATCEQPGDIFVSSVATDAVTFSWSDNNTPVSGSWEIMVLPATAPAPLQSATGWTTVTSTSYTLSGLEAATAYKLYIRSVCAADNKSFWSTGQAFTTAVCDGDNVCEYTFIMDDSVGGGWSNNTMQVIQAGAVVYTLNGPDYGASSPESVSVSLCNNIPFEVYWNNVGLAVGTVSLAIQDPAGNPVYELGFDESYDIYGTTIYTGAVTCTPSTCPKPVQLYVTGLSATSATLGWTEAGSASQWEILVVPAGSPAPSTGDTGVITSSNPYSVTLANATIYDFYVRAICSSTESSIWTGPKSFTPLLENDECSAAAILPVNTGVECIQSVQGSLAGATGSSQINSCTGTADDDVWYKFTATGPLHSVTISNVEGAGFDYQPISYVIYQGSGCQDLASLVCTGTDVIPLTELVSGNEYFIRIFTKDNAQFQNVTFDICISTIPPAVAISTTQYTHEELVRDILIDSDCASVSNITSFTGTDYNVNGIAYFENNGSSLPFADGIILSTTNATIGGRFYPQLPEHNTYDVGQEWPWPGDAQLDQILLEQGINNQFGTTNNASLIEFDFVPLINSISFRYLLASDEYGGFQCFYSDMFAFLLTDLDTGITTNLAVIPGTDTIVSSTTIKDNQYFTGNPVPDGCVSSYPELFDAYYRLPQGQDHLLAPAAFDGFTKPLTATGPVIPGHQYRIKLVVADYFDYARPSAVFLEGGSFNLGNVDFGDDLLVATTNAVCYGDTKTLASGLDTELYTFVWQQDGTPIAGETGASLTVTEPGIYTLEAQYINSICITGDSITVEFYEQLQPGTPVNIAVCGTAGTAVFDLTQNDAAILEPLGAGYTVSYFTTAEGAANNASAIAPADAYTSLSNQQTIFGRVSNDLTGCFTVVQFDISSNETAPQFTMPAEAFLCQGTPLELAVAPGNFELQDASYAWSLDTVALSDTTPVITVTQVGLYEVTVTLNGCSTVAQTQVNAGTQMDPLFDAIGEICQNITAPVLPLTSLNGISGTWSPSEIDATTAGSTEYVFTSAASNCCITFVMNVNVTDEPDFVIEGACDGNIYMLKAVPNGFDPEAVSYQWLDEQGNELPQGTAGSYLPERAGEYFLEIILGDCSYIASYTVNTVTCFIQRGISPNGDGMNDFFDLEGLGASHLGIYNRYGMKVYSLSNYTNQWNGQSDSGEELPTGTYYYVIERNDGKSNTGWIYINRQDN